MSLLGLGAVAAVILTWKTLGASPTPTAHVYRLFPLERTTTRAAQLAACLAGSAPSYYLRPGRDSPQKLLI